MTPQQRVSVINSAESCNRDGSGWPCTTPTVTTITTTFAAFAAVTTTTTTSLPAFSDNYPASPSLTTLRSATTTNTTHSPFSLTSSFRFLDVIFLSSSVSAFVCLCVGDRRDSLLKFIPSVRTASVEEEKLVCFFVWLLLSPAQCIVYTCQRRTGLDNCTC